MTARWRRPPPGRAQQRGQDVVDADTETGTEDEADPPLFATRSGHPIDQPYVFPLLQRGAAAAGIDQVDRLSPHSLRHSVATLLPDRGNPLHVVQDFLGHAAPVCAARTCPGDGLAEPLITWEGRGRWS